MTGRYSDSTITALYTPGPSQINTAIAILQTANRKAEHLTDGWAYTFPLKKGDYGRCTGLNEATIIARAHQMLKLSGVEHVDQCRFSEALCDGCRRGLYVRRTRRTDGLIFWGCSEFPTCKGSLSDEEMTAGRQPKLHYKASERITRATDIDRMVPPLERTHAQFDGSLAVLDDYRFRFLSDDYGGDNEC